MSRSAGTYTPPASSWSPAVNGASATFGDWNALLTDLSNALTQSIAVDGQSVVTANLPMAGFKLTGLGAASAATDSARAGDIQSGSWQYLTGVAGTNTVTANLTGLAAYAAGQAFRFIVANTNTGAVTLNVNSVGAKAITKNGATALAAGDLLAGSAVEVIYDGTQFQLVSVNIPSVIVGRAYAEYTTNTNLTAVIPFDDTIPQVGEGTEILAASITPKSTTNRLRVRFEGWGSVATSGDLITAAVFINAGANAVAAAASAPAVSPGAGVGLIVVEYEFVPGTTSAQAFTVRVGATSGTIRMNGTTAARRFGGVSRSTLVIEEITA